MTNEDWEIRALSAEARLVIYAKRDAELMQAYREAIAQLQEKLAEAQELLTQASSELKDSDAWKRWELSTGKRQQP